MKFTIELTDAEVKGIKEYLKEVDGIEKPTKADIQREVNNLTIPVCPKCGGNDIRTYRDHLCCYMCGEYFKP